jgi:serine/threonine-protein kinase
MAPEAIIDPTKVDARTDLYAVGVVLYEMIVGQRPFNAEDTLQLLGMHRAAPIPRLADNVKEGTELPVGMQEVVDKAMAKSAKDRYQSAIEFAKAIDEVAAGKLDPMEIDATLPKMKSGPVAAPSASSLALADTAANISTTDVVRALEPKKKGRGGTWVGLLLLVGGASGMAAYLIGRGHDEAPGNPKVADLALDAGSAAGDLPLPVVADASITMVAPADDASVAADALGDAAAVADTGDAGVAEEEIQIDPTQASDPDEANKGSAALPEDEAANAPQTEAEVEKVEAAPPEPQIARTVHDAVVLIQKGEKPLALSSLRQLWKKQPSSAYIPFLMGNLYFDKQWWGVALEHYKAAIKKNQGYRRNPVLNKNVIHMLISTKTRQAATNFLRGVIGSYSKAYLKYAAAHDPSDVVRKQAANLARYIR